MHHIKSFASHSVSAILEAALIATLIVGLFAVPVLAAKGGNGGGGGKSGGSLTLVVLDGTDAVANHHERVTFDVVTSADRPFVGLRCWQGEAWVYDAYVGYFEGYMFDPWFTLDSPYWTAGVDATCTARLFTYNRRGGENAIASTSFTVAP